MMENNLVEGVVRQLRAMGFPPAVDTQLRLHALLAPGGFVLPFRLENGGDQLLVKAAIQRRADTGSYTCGYFDATLRKAVEVPDITVSEVSVRVLDEEMGRLDWKEILAGQDKDLQAAGEKVLEVERVVAQLQRLGSTPEGEAVVQRLTARHWWGTPLESYCPDLQVVRSSCEVQQRFYLFEEGGLITLEEAYRYLCYRWQERRMQEAQRAAKRALEERLPPLPGDTPRELRRPAKEGKAKGPQKG